MRLHEYPQRRPGLFLILLLLGGIVFRFLLAGIMLDFHSDDYWEYGALGKNLLAGNGYSLFSCDGNTVEVAFAPDRTPEPSAYMPPGYVFFLLPFLLIGNVVLRNLLLLLTQSLLAALAGWLLFRYTRHHLNVPIALLATAIYCFTPELAYASLSWTPTVLTHLFFMGLLLSLDNLDTECSWKSAVRFGIWGTMLLYLRSEAALILMILILARLIPTLKSKKLSVCNSFTSRLTSTLMVAGVILLLFSPWPIRNAVVFEKFIPLTTSAGLNFYRGHNPDAIGDWGDADTEREVRSLAPGRDWELRYVDVYRRHAWDAIHEHPGRELWGTVQKVFHLWIVFSHDPRALHPVVLIPWLVMLPFFVTGMVLSGKNNGFLYLNLMLIGFTLISMLFFAQPRYQTMMKILCLPYIASGLYFTLAYLQKKKRDA